MGVLIAVIVPVNLKTEDKFHLTIEEYLHAVISLVEELVDHPPLGLEGFSLSNTAGTNRLVSQPTLSPSATSSAHK